MTSLRPHTEFMDKALKAVLPGSRLHVELSMISKVSETLGFVFKLLYRAQESHKQGGNRKEREKNEQSMPESVCYPVFSQPEELITLDNKSQGLEALFYGDSWNKTRSVLSDTVSW